MFKIDSPQPLVRVQAAAQFQVRVPPPENCDFHMELSTDGGRTWREFARAEMPSDNEYSSGWMYGASDVSDTDARSSLVRVNLYAGGTQTGLIDAQLYGIYRTGDPQPVTVTYGWREGDQEKQHVERVPGGTAEHGFDVPTGEAIVDEFVRIAAD